MRIYVKEKFGVEIGRLPWSGRYGIHVCFGWIDHAPEGYVNWRHWWVWEPRLPKLLWCRGRLIGFCAFGRCRVWR